MIPYSDTNAAESLITSLENIAETQEEIDRFHMGGGRAPHHLHERLNRYLKILGGSLIYAMELAQDDTETERDN